jgi:uncharacterized RDD family membrane protein YckC
VATSPQTTPYPLGSRTARFAAQIIDGLVILIPLGVLSAAFGQGGLLIVLYLAGLALYAPWLMARPGERNGQTLGKQALGLRVVRLSGEPMTFGAGFRREAIGRTLLWIVTATLYFWIDSLWCLGDKRKQTLHDKIGQTLVVPASAHLAADPATA